jgi:hypothetical protein
VCSPNSGPGATTRPGVRDKPRHDTGHRGRRLEARRELGIGREIGSRLDRADRNRVLAQHGSQLEHADVVPRRRFHAAEPGTPGPESADRPRLRPTIGRAGGDATGGLAIGAWLRGHARWLALGLALGAAVAVALATRDGSRPGPVVRGEHLARPDTTSPSTSSPAAATTTSTAASPATTSGATVPAAATPRRGAAPARAVGSATTTSSTTTSSTTTTTSTTVGTPAPPPELAPPLSALRVLDWSPGFVAEQGATVWAVDTLDSGRLARLDTGGARAQGGVRPFVSGLVPVAGGAWVLRSSCPTGAAELLHVDATAAPVATHALTQTVVCDVGPDRSALAATPGALWIATADPARPGNGILLDVDPTTGAVVDRVTFAGTPHSVRADGAAVWVTLSDEPSVAANDLLLEAFDPATRRQIRRVVAGSPLGLPIVRRGNIWVGGTSGLRRIPQGGGAEQAYATDGPGCGSGARFGFVAGGVTATTVWGTRLDVAGNGPTGPITQASVCRVDIASGRTAGWSPGALAVVGGDDTGAWLVDQALGGLVRWTVT